MIKVGGFLTRNQTKNPFANSSPGTRWWVDWSSISVAPHQGLHGELYHLNDTIL
ncbi:unnamed protein product, partial [Vitis vinifera]|uniref:Uncharacterized protein n=1 Tax=Vitis vinifera TaxID=29760 RepID=D7TFW0_VITVI